MGGKQQHGCVEFCLQTGSSWAQHLRTVNNARLLLLPAAPRSRAGLARRRAPRLRAPRLRTPCFRALGPVLAYTKAALCADRSASSRLQGSLKGFPRQRGPRPTTVPTITSRNTRSLEPRPCLYTRSLEPRPTTQSKCTASPTCKASTKAPFATPGVLSSRERRRTTTRRTRKDVQLRTFSLDPRQLQPTAHAQIMCRPLPATLCGSSATSVRPRQLRTLPPTVLAKRTRGASQAIARRPWPCSRPCQQAAARHPPESVMSPCSTQCESRAPTAYYALCSPRR